MKNFALLSILCAFTLYSCQNPEEEDNNSKVEQAISPAPQNQDNIKWNSPIDSLNLILKQNPDNAEAYLSRAEKFLAIKSYQAAAADIYNAMQLDSSSAQARNLKGQLNFIQNKSRLAKQEWEKMCTVRC